MSGEPNRLSRGGGISRGIWEMASGCKATAASAMLVPRASSSCARLHPLGSLRLGRSRHMTQEITMQQAKELGEWLCLRVREYERAERRARWRQRLGWLRRMRRAVSW
jgi:hypothetical protein